MAAAKSITDSYYAIELMLYISHSPKSVFKVQIHKHRIIKITSIINRSDNKNPDHLIYTRQLISLIIPL